MKVNIFKNKKVAELKEKLETLEKTMKYKTNQLEAEIFRLKYPNGDILYNSYRSIYIFPYNEVYFKYAYKDKVSEYITIYTMYNTSEELTAYKSVIKDSYAYIGLKIELKGNVSERYFIVDMSDGKVIECTNQDALNTVDWVSTDKL